jgi:hypothetical protein
LISYMKTMEKQKRRPLNKKIMKKLMPKNGFEISQYSSTFFFV